LRDQGFSEPREKANQLIQQLRERNFILCYRGADTYGFVHRTFLEYFCAVEIVQRFEKQRSISLKELRDEVFGKHWQDEAWHEVLRLICGMIEQKFTSQIISFLIQKEGNSNRFNNFFLAAQCLGEIKNWIELLPVSIKLLEYLKDLSTYGWRQENSFLVREIRYKSVEIIATVWRSDPQTFSWLKVCLHSRLDENDAARQAAILALARQWRENPETLSILKTYAQAGNEHNLQRIALQELNKV
jgi:predicted NACHT family NTPase